MFQKSAQIEVHEALSPREVVRIFELAGLRRCYADGDVVDNNELLQRLPPLTFVRDYATRVTIAGAH